MKPRVCRVLVCLLLGAVTTVAVAWVFALRVVVPLRTQSYVAAEGLWEGTTFGTDLWCQVKRRPGLLVVCWEPVQVSIGRSSDADVRLPDKQASRLHARIERDWHPEHGVRYLISD
ncbi:MAG: FHA domain-containing protein, partial [Planctomycetes bacterium]|nr:FHA domain-containing protein [Planctomycetota bacterium]